MEIITYPNAVLKAKCLVVESIDSTIRDNVDKMFELMSRLDGCGLAANQVGLLNRLFVVREPRLVFINPIITKCSYIVESEEGCLSIPNFTAKVNRYSTIVVEAYDIDGKMFVKRCKGLLSYIVQHEIDHLNGILLIDK